MNHTHHIRFFFWSAKASGAIQIVSRTHTCDLSSSSHLRCRHKRAARAVDSAHLVVQKNVRCLLWLTSDLWTFVSEICVPLVFIPNRLVLALAFQLIWVKTIFYSKKVNVIRLDIESFPPTSRCYSQCRPIQCQLGMTCVSSVPNV